MGGVGAIVCGCCSSGRVYWGTRVGRGIAGCRQTCVAERVFRSVLRGVLGVVLCWASCSRVVLHQGGGIVRESPCG